MNIVEKVSSKEEYTKTILEIRKQELESIKFKAISSFLEDYNKRENIELEQELFEIIGTRSIDDDFVPEKYGKLDRFIKLKIFLNSLTQEQLESNIYLRKAYELFNLSFKDCEEIIMNLEKEMLTTNFSVINLDINIPSETVKILPTIVSEQAIVPLSENEFDFVNVLDEENKYIYSNYNKYVNKIDNLAEDIYNLQINKMLLDCPYEIENNTLNIFNSSKEQKFITSFNVVTKRKLLN